jgi:hypothetical protein
MVSGRNWPFSACGKPTSSDTHAGRRFIHFDLEEERNISGAIQPSTE